jgi:hypothetical protein
VLTCALLRRCCAVVCTDDIAELYPTIKRMGIIDYSRARTLLDRVATGKGTDSPFVTSRLRHSAATVLDAALRADPLNGLWKAEARAVRRGQSLKTAVATAEGPGVGDRKGSGDALPLRRQTTAEADAAAIALAAGAAAATDADPSAPASPPERRGEVGSSTLNVSGLHDAFIRTAWALLAELKDAATTKAGQPLPPSRAAAKAAAAGQAKAKTKPKTSADAGSAVVLPPTPAGVLLAAEHKSSGAAAVGAAPQPVTPPPSSPTSPLSAPVQWTDRTRCFRTAFTSSTRHSVDYFRCAGCALCASAGSGADLKWICAACAAVCHSGPGHALSSFQTAHVPDYGACYCGKNRKMCKLMSAPTASLQSPS